MHLTIGGSPPLARRTLIGGQRLSGRHRFTSARAENTLADLVLFRRFASSLRRVNGIVLDQPTQPVGAVISSSPDPFSLTIRGRWATRSPWSVLGANGNMSSNRSVSKSARPRFRRRPRRY